MKKLAVIVLSLFLCDPAPAAVAFRAIATATKGTAANFTLTEPAGSTDNDIEIACIELQAEPPPTITGPAGWSNSMNGTTMSGVTTTAGQQQRCTAWWIRRSGAPALTWTHTSCFHAGSIVGYSGAATSGDPFSFGATAIRDDSTAATYPAVSGTTAVANEMLIWCGCNWQGGTAGTPPTSFTERLDSNGNASTTEMAEFLQAAAGPTGSITGANYTGTNGTVATLMGSLKPPTATGTVCPSIIGAGILCGQ